MADYYNILGVDKNVSDSELKKAFRKMAHKYHPDKDGGDEAKFKEVNEAYQVLSDKNKRAQYDQFGSAGPGGQGFGGFGNAGGFDFSNFGGQGGGFEFNFGGNEDVFSEMFGRGGRRAGAKGRDMQVSLSISFLEMIEGAKKTISIRKSVTCSHCDGSGGEPKSGEKTCTGCDGSGRVRKVMQTILGNIAQEAVCDTCKGKGKQYEKSCTTCGGDGHDVKNVEEEVEIPAGISSGQTVAFSGKGMAGEHGMQPGDLLVQIDVRGDDRFEREGNNIVSNAHINFAHAALGTKIDIETVEGSVKMKIPAGTQSGEIFRIKGKGVPKLQSFGRGDHLVTIKVDIPTKLSRTQKKMIQELEKNL